MSQKLLSRKQANPNTVDSVTQDTTQSNNTSLVSHFPSIDNSFSQPDYLQSQRMQTTTIHNIPQNQASNIEIDDEEIEVDQDEILRMANIQSMPQNSYKMQNLTISYQENSPLNNQLANLNFDQYYDSQNSMQPEILQSTIPIPQVTSTTNLEQELEALENTYQAYQTPSKQVTKNRYYQDSSLSEEHSNSANQLMSQRQQTSFDSLPSVDLTASKKSLQSKYQPFVASQSLEMQQSTNIPRSRIPPKPQQQKIKSQEQHQVIELETLVQQYREECQNQQKIIKNLSEQNQNKPVASIPANELRLQLERERYGFAENEQQYMQTIKELQKIISEVQEKFKQQEDFVNKLRKLAKVDATVNFAQLLTIFEKSLQATKPINSQVFVEQLQGAMGDIQQLQQIIKQKDQQISLLETGKLPDSSLKSEISRRDEQIRDLTDQLNQQRIQLMQRPQFNQQILQEELQQTKEALQQLEQLRSFDKNKIKIQEQEYQSRLQEVENFSQQQISDLRKNNDKRITDLQMKIQTLEGKISYLQQDNDEITRKYQKLSQDSSSERFVEFSRRINQIEQLPDGKYGREIMERAIKAESQLTEERDKYQKVLRDKENQIAGFQVEIASLVEDISNLMQGY